MEIILAEHVQVSIQNAVEHYLVSALAPGDMLTG
jgi:hypothetical protein